MGQQGDYGQYGDYGQEQARRPRQDPRSGPAATPPQWGQQAPPRQDGTRGYPAGPQAQPVFRPTSYPAQPQPPRGQYPPPQPARQPQPQPAPGPPPHRKRHTGRKVFGALVGLGAAIIVISVAANSGHGTTSTPSAGPGTQTQTAAPAAQAPAQPAAGAAANTGPAGTTSELQALAAAQGYLSDGQGFSRQGLIGQLDSTDGSDFSVADATWAVDHSGANWDDQAVDSAKGYMSDGQGFSRDGLIEQMTSSYGSQFTEAQAEYAANAVGL